MHTLRHILRRYGARFMGLRLRDGTFILMFVWRGRTSQIQVIDSETFDPARGGFEIATETGGCGHGEWGRVEKLDLVKFPRWRLAIG